MAISSEVAPYVYKSTMTYSKFEMSNAVDLNTLWLHMIRFPAVACRQTSDHAGFLLQFLVWEAMNWKDQK